MSDALPSVDTTRPENTPPESAVQLLHVAYGLLALGCVASLAATSAMFLLLGAGALIIAYIKKSEAQGSFLSSHCDWIAKTFWWTLAAFVVLVILTLATVGVAIFSAATSSVATLIASAGGFVLLWLIAFFALWAWGVYRTIRGWIHLGQKRTA
jgi:uncharacterized membrane protein